MMNQRIKASRQILIPEHATPVRASNPEAPNPILFKDITFYVWYEQDELFIVTTWERFRDENLAGKLPPAVEKDILGSAMKKRLGI